MTATKQSELSVKLLQRCRQAVPHHTIGQIPAIVCLWHYASLQITLKA